MLELLLLAFPMATSQTTDITSTTITYPWVKTTDFFQQKPIYVNNIKDSIIINTLLQSNLSSLVTSLKKKQTLQSSQPSQHEGCPYAELVGDGECDDGKISH